MTILETLNVKITADITDLVKTMAAVAEETEKATKKLKEKKAEDKKKGASFSVLTEIQKLANDDIFSEVSLDKVFSEETLSEANKEALKGIEDLKNVLEEKLSAILEAERKRLDADKVDPAEIDARLKAIEGGANKVIDDLVDDFTDTLEEAVTDLSQKIADAFVDMALKGEFSIKTIGDIFLKTFLDIIAKELIQKPLEELLGGLFDAGSNILFGSATGGEISAGVPTFINERGQEVFIPHTPGKIVNADQTRHMFGQGRGIVVNQNLSFDTAIKNDMVGVILQASPLLIEHTKIAVLESLQGRRI